MSELKLKEPVSLVFIDIYRDGGTLSLVLEDRDRASLSFTIDGSLGSFTPNRIFLEGEFPDGRRSQMIPKGDPREAAIVVYLETWLAETYSSRELKDLRDSYGRKPLDERQRMAALCLSAVERIRA